MLRSLFAGVSGLRNHQVRMDVIGNNVANQNNSYSRDVRRCENVSNPRPEYWDVTYNYRGVQHRVQMSTPPGNTIAVNSKTGEPRM